MLYNFIETEPAHVSPKTYHKLKQNIRGREMTKFKNGEDVEKEKMNQETQMFN